MLFTSFTTTILVVVPNTRCYVHCPVKLSDSNFSQNGVHGRAVKGEYGNANCFVTKINDGRLLLINEINFWLENVDQ